MIKIGGTRNMYWFDQQMIQTFANDIAREDLFQLVKIYHIRETDQDRRYHEPEFVMEFTNMFLTHRNKILSERHDLFLSLSSADANQLIREFWREVLYTKIIQQNP